MQINVAAISNTTAISLTQPPMANADNLGGPPYEVFVYVFTKEGKFDSFYPIRHQISRSNSRFNAYLKERFLNATPNPVLGSFVGGSAKIPPDSKCPIVKPKMVGKNCTHCKERIAHVECTGFNEHSFCGAFWKYSESVFHPFSL